MADPADTVSHKTALQHVLWIGGAPDSGKTTVARRLAVRYELAIYLQDAQTGHRTRITREHQPHSYAFNDMTMDQRWVERSPIDMAEQIVTIAAERFSMVVEDLLSMPKKPMILAEGPWLFPELVAPLLWSPRQALWLVPTEEFKRASAARRDKPTIRHRTSDPARAETNWFQRDLLIRDHILRQARGLGSTVRLVDGSLSIDEMVALAEKHFSPMLTGEAGLSER